MIRACRIHVKQNVLLKTDGTERLVNQVCVSIGDLHLSCDADARAIRLAKWLADDHQATFYYDDVNADMCRKVLGITA